MMTVRKSSQILGVGVGSGTLDEIVQESLTRIDKHDQTSTFVCANPHSLVESTKDKDFYNALNRADFSVADGVGVTMVAKLTNKDVGPRIAGHNYFEALMAALNERGSGRVFFFGSSPHVLELIEQQFIKDYPNIDLCGLISPPFGDWPDNTNNEMINEINKKNPDVLWVGMTAPKQEKWAEKNRSSLSAPIIGSIGAVFDFYAGTYPRAPEWMRKLGLEWLFRLIKEPKRMWRRNFISTPLFIWLFIWRDILQSIRQRK